MGKPDDPGMRVYFQVQGKFKDMETSEKSFSPHPFDILYPNAISSG